MTAHSFSFLTAIVSAALAVPLTTSPLITTAVHAQQTAPAQPADPNYRPETGQAGKDVVWVPTPDELVAAMLDAAKVRKDDTVIDLGSGDGRTVIAAAKRGARAIGIEFNADMVEFAKRAAAREGVKATFVHGDIFQTDFSHATVLTLFLLPQLNIKLRPTILNMKPGTRVVSHSFDMSDWEPDATVQATGDTCTLHCGAHFWLVPAKVEGTWQTQQGELTLSQNFQFVSGSIKAPSGAQTSVTGRLAGANISLVVGNATYNGRVDGDSFTATGPGGGLQGKRAK